MKILKASLANSEGKKIVMTEDGNAVFTRFGIQFDIELNDDDIFNLATLSECAAGMINDDDITNASKEKINKAFEVALNEFVKRMVSRE